MTYHAVILVEEPVFILVRVLAILLVLPVVSAMIIIVFIREVGVAIRGRFVVGARGILEVVLEVLGMVILAVVFVIGELLSPASLEFFASLLLLLRLGRLRCSTRVVN